MERRVICILGCTASGKGAAARSLALALGGEILSIDSMKIYRGMDIGTNKPTPAERALVAHHLLDVADPWESFSAARFVELADAAVAQVHGRGRPVIAVGGTVLYFKAFYNGLFTGPAADAALRESLRSRAAWEGAAALHDELRRVDPESAARIHANDLRRIERALEVYLLTGTPISALQRQWEAGAPIRRPEWSWRLLGLRFAREAAGRRINARVRAMVAAGLVEEARGLWDDPRGVGRQAAQAVGYAELFAHFRGEWPLQHAIERIKINSRRLAKQQATWLKRLAGVEWVAGDDASASDTLLALAQKPAAEKA